MNSHFALQTSHFSRAGVVAERAFVAQRLARINVTFVDEVGIGGDFEVVGQSRFPFRQCCFKPRPARVKRNWKNFWKNFLTRFPDVKESL